MSFLFSVSVIQHFTNELRMVSAIIEASMNRTQELQDDLRGCQDIMGDALRGFVLRVAAFNSTEDEEEPEVIQDVDWTGGWPLYVSMALSFSIVGLLTLIADHLGVPRTTVSEFLNSF